MKLRISYHIGQYENIQREQIISKNQRVNHQMIKLSFISKHSDINSVIYQSLLFLLNKHQRIPKGQSKKDSPEKMAIYKMQSIQDKEKQTKTQHNVLDNIKRKTNTNNVNKTCTLLHTTGGKDEPNIVSMRKS